MLVSAFLLKIKTFLHFAHCVLHITGYYMGDILTQIEFNLNTRPFFQSLCVYVFAPRAGVDALSSHLLVHCCVFILQFPL